MKYILLLLLVSGYALAQITAGGTAQGGIVQNPDICGGPLAVAGGTPDGVTGQYYNFNFATGINNGNPYNSGTVGGCAPYTYSVFSGSLPPGLSLSIAGVLSGTPTAAGTYNFTIQIADSVGTNITSARGISITGGSTLAVSTTSLPNGTQYQSYSATVNATGGTTPYSWAVTVGSLPTGLTLNSSTAQISGVPSGTGTSSFTVQVTDAVAATASKALSITITPPPPLTISTTSLPNATVNVAYNTTLAASGGTPPYTWSLQSGSLPSGITLSTGGVISGLTATSGTYNFTAKVADSVAASATQALTLTVAAATLSSIAVSPTSTSVVPSGTSPFTARCYYTGGTNSDCTSSVTWYVDNIVGGNSTVGTINSGGLYTAPSTLGSHSIKCVLNTVTSNTATITVANIAAGELLRGCSVNSSNTLTGCSSGNNSVPSGWTLWLGEGFESSSWCAQTGKGEWCYYGGARQTAQVHSGTYSMNSGFAMAGNNGGNLGFQSSNVPGGSAFYISWWQWQTDWTGTNNASWYTFDGGDWPWVDQKSSDGAEWALNPDGSSGDVSGKCPTGHCGSCNTTPGGTCSNLCPRSLPWDHRSCFLPGTMQRYDIPGRALTNAYPMGEIWGGFDGSWHQYEIYIIPNSACTSANCTNSPSNSSYWNYDGTFEMWIDGTLMVNNTAFNYTGANTQRNKVTNMTWYGHWAPSMWLDMSYGSCSTQLTTWKNSGYSVGSAPHCGPTYCDLANYPAPFSAINAACSGEGPPGTLQRYIDDVVILYR